MNRALALCTISALAACNAPSSSTTVPDPNVSTAPAKSSTGHVPTIGTGAMPMFLSGGFTLGAAAPGSATLTQATRWLETEDHPASWGGGHFSVTVDGTTYDVSSAQSFYGLATDDSGTGYLIAGALQIDETARTARVLYVVTKQSDYAVGAEVALDGADRVALFAAGSLDADAPEVYAAATSGTVRFSSGDPNASAPIDLTLDAAFAPATWDGDGGSGGGGGNGDGGTGPTLAQGAYNLHFDGGAAQARCGGTLAGHEAEFAALTPAAAGFTDVAVQLATADSLLTLTGPDLVAGFGGDTIYLEPGSASSSGTWLGVSHFAQGTAGPHGTTKRGAGVQLTPGAGSAPIAGHVFAFYVVGNAADDVCQVDYPITLQ